MNMTPSEDGGPYVGRRAFTLDDHNVFFGRDGEIEELSTLWRTSPLVVLDGLAGSGKTSLLQAGIGALAAADGDLLLGRPFGASFFPEPLLDQYNPFSLAVLASWSPGESRTRLAGQSITDFLRSRAQSGRWRRRGSLLLAAIDQVESVLVDDRGVQARDEFFADLAAALDEIPDLRLLLITRTDMLGRLLPYEKRLSPGGAVRFSVEPLTVPTALMAVQGPMEMAGNRFDVGAASYIVDKLQSVLPYTMADAPSVQPTQLQVVCAELWHVSQAGQSAITLGFVQDSIDVDRILVNFSASVISEAGDRFQISPNRIFDWLVTFFVSSDPAPVEVPEDELAAAGIPAGVLRMLEDEHFLSAGNSLGVKKYQLANDHLVTAMRYLARSPVFGQTKGDALARIREAESALASGELELAQKHAEEALNSVSQAETRLRADVLSLLGNITYRLGRPDRAEKNYRDAAQLREQLGDQPGVGRLYGAIGCIHSRQGQYLQALEELQAAVGRSPSDLSLQTKLGTVLRRSGQSQAAAAVFGAVLSVEPESADALAGRVQIAVERGTVEAVRDDLETLRRLRPSSARQPEVRLARALALAVQGMPESALAEVDAAIAAAGDSAEIFASAARVALASGATDRAKKLLRQAEKASHPALSPSQRAQVHRLTAEADTSDSAPDQYDR